MPRRSYQLAAMLVATVLLPGTLASCGQPDSTPTATSSAAATGTRVASSFSDRIQDLIDNQSSAHPMSQTQVDMLRRALDHDGIVSAADYEQAWSNYRQCVVDKGYNAPPAVRYGNGLYSPVSTTDTNGLTQEQGLKVSEDRTACFMEHAISVDEMYRYATANPDMLTDPDEATVDCLQRAKAAPTSYTVAQYRKEKEAYDQDLSQQYESGTDVTKDPGKFYTISLGDPAVVTCMVANGSTLFSTPEQSWKPFG